MAVKFRPHRSQQSRALKEARLGVSVMKFWGEAPQQGDYVGHAATAWRLATAFVLPKTSESTASEIVYATVVDQSALSEE